MTLDEIVNVKTLDGFFICDFTKYKKLNLQNNITTIITQQAHKTTP